MKGSSVLYGAIDASVILLIMFAIIVWLKPFNYRVAYVLNPQKVVTNSLQTDTLTCNHFAVLQDLEKKGLLLTPQEYTSHIASYYSTLIAFLIGLFVLFTIGSIYGIRITARKELEEAKLNIKNELKESLANEIKDSKSFNESIIDAVVKNLKDIILTKSDDTIKEIDSKIKNIEDKQTKLSEDIEFIYEEIDIDSKSEIKE